MALWSWKSGLSWALRVATLLSSLATVILFVVFLVDRTDQENIQAWHILQGYKGEAYNLGQTLALETLVRNHQSLRRLQLSGAWLDGADLRGADMKLARLMTAHFESARLDYANLADGVLSYSVFGTVDVAAPTSRTALYRRVISKEQTWIAPNSTVQS